MDETKTACVPESDVRRGSGCSADAAESVVRSVRSGDLRGGENPLPGLCPVEFRLLRAAEIEENTAAVQLSIQEAVARAAALPRDAAHLPDIRRIRADINKQHNEMEAARKAVKKAVLAPYNAAEKAYKEKVGKHYEEADAFLAGIISGVEDGLKGACEERLRQYFTELADALGLGFIRFEDVGLKIDLASAKQETPRKLMGQINEYLNQVQDDLKVIASLPFANEVMAEYQKCRSVSEAAKAVNERLERMAAIEGIVRSLPKLFRDEEKHAEEVTEAAGAKKPEEEYTCTFSVTASLPKLKALKAWMDANGCKYEES